MNAHNRNSLPFPDKCSALVPQAFTILSRLEPIIEIVNRHHVRSVSNNIKERKSKSLGIFDIRILNKITEDL
jgi:hypothetical protein